MAAVSDYRMLLHRVSEEITSGELESLMFLCADFIPSHRREEINSTRNLIIELERKGELSETNLVTLIELLRLIRRRDLVKLVHEFAFRNEGSPAVWKKSGNEPVNHNLTRVGELQELDWDHLYTDSSTAG